MECSATPPFPIRSVISMVSSTSREGVSRFSILCGFVTIDLYWLYLIFISHVMNPVSVSVVDSQTGRHLLSGQIGSLVATVARREVLSAVLASLIVFVLATAVANAAEKIPALWREAASRRFQCQAATL